MKNIKNAVKMRFEARCIRQVTVGFLDIWRIVLILTYNSVMFEVETGIEDKLLAAQHSSIQLQLSWLG